MNYGTDIGMWACVSRRVRLTAKHVSSTYIGEAE